MNPEHVEIVRHGKNAVQQWREENPGVRLDLSGAQMMCANLSGLNLREANLAKVYLGEANMRNVILAKADLTGADLSKTWLMGADLTEANLSEAFLFKAYLCGADLYGANLSGATLTKADLFRADLTKANLSGAGLTAAMLYRTNLYGADLTGASFNWAALASTIFADVDLSTAKGLETAEHHGPSPVDVATLSRSGGKIPQAFLRDCGVPDEFLTSLPSLLSTQQTIQSHLCIISYNSRDEEFVRRLQDRLHQAGLPIWYAQIHKGSWTFGGCSLREQIGNAIPDHSLLLVLSEDCLREEWVKSEIRKARAAGMEAKRRTLFPIRLMDSKRLEEWQCLDADSDKDLGVELREYFIHDFQNWKDHDAFEAGITKLLNDLRASETKPPEA